MNIGSSKKGGPVGASAGKTPHGLDQSSSTGKDEGRPLSSGQGWGGQSINNCAIFGLIK